MELKVPSLKEIQVRTNEDINILPSLLKEANAGNSPIIINIDSFSKDNVIKFLDLLYPMLKQINLHPKFPYPIMIKTSKITDHEKYMIINEHNDIPTHFLFQHDKKLLQKEAAMMQKVSLNNRRISNSGPFEKEEEIYNTFSINKELLRQLEKLEYYESILSGLRKF